MIDIVASGMAQELSSLPFLTLVGGIARSQKIKADGVTKNLPAIQDPNNSGSYIWLTPNTKEAGIAYFENQGNELSDSVGGGRGQSYKATLRVVVWLNLGRIAPPDVGAMMSQVVSKLSAYKGDSGFIQSVRVVPIREVPRTADIFSKYTYNEAETQYLMLPYDYFAFDFDVRYILNTSCHIVGFAQKTPTAC